ncbi:hypothetical protein INT48_000823 [Thamnidium elegans]|uniref:Uncharacterized protein n=1 Tax=Thamnidium elegans TaxID=101142 RepID=A0A8H7SY24_9FUNG|nr:hypothetical protein INT48_000823 [Thamnidium elegans]
MNNNNLIEIESKDFLYVRQEIQRLADSLVDDETSNEEERERNKSEMEQASINVQYFIPFFFVLTLFFYFFIFQWLNGVWSNFPGNIVLTDNPNFNFNEPIHVREPLDESLEFQVNESKQQYHKLSEELFNTREELTGVVASFTTESLQGQSKEASELTIVDTAPPKNETAKVDRDNTKQVETVYNEAVEILSNLEKTVPEQVSKFEAILELAK